MSEPARVPWYATVSGPALAQGDFVDRCPILVPPPTIDPGLVDADIPARTLVGWERYDVVVVTQSCDLELEKVDLVLVCPQFPLSRLADEHPFFRSSRGKEELRRGNVPGYHILAACDLAGFEAEVRVVELRTVYTVPLAFLQQVGSARGRRLRLNSPYREHLAQAFARFIMRVGLPVDIPPFR